MGDFLLWLAKVYSYIAVFTAGAVAEHLSIKQPKLEPVVAVVAVVIAGSCWPVALFHKD